MALGGCGNGADGARAGQFNSGSSTGQQQHGGRPLDWQGNGNANRSGSGNHDANASGSQRSWKGIKDNNLYDPWNHAWPYYGGFDCMYCSLKHKGGGATRVAEHLGGIVAQWWFQFGGDVPALQKCAMRICSQCVSSSGCERNWSAFALVHTKQRNRLLYDKLHKLVSVRYNLKIRAEEDQERDMDKEIDPSALLMDTTMFDETNPIMEWLNEDEEDPIIDGADAASAVFEKIRRLNSSRKASYVAKGDNNKRKRNNDEENEYVDTESEDDVEENGFVDSESEDNGGVSEEEEDDPSMQDEQEAQMQVEKETQIQVEKEAPPSNGNLETRRSVRLVKKKTKDVNSLYP